MVHHVPHAHLPAATLRGAVPRLHLEDEGEGLILVVQTIEVLNVLRRLRALGTIAAADGAAEVVALTAAADIQRHPVVPLLLDMWRLRHNVTGYDAAYVALAAHLSLPLATADQRLANAPNLPCAVEAF